MKKKAFTLVELIVVLVILSIIALIAIPIVYNIIDKSEKNSYKKSVDNYAHAIENAIMVYKMEHGRYATELSQLNVEYSGYHVKCNEIELNKNGTVYLNKCYVNNNKVKDDKNRDGYYHYGKILYDYNIGDIVTYKNIQFYVIKGSKPNDEYVTLIKSEPLKYNEVSSYSSQYSMSNYSGYLGMCYCDTSEFINSNIKRVLDLWVNDSLDNNDLVEDDLGYKIRLLTYDELIERLGYDVNLESAGSIASTDYVPKFLYESYYDYWTLSNKEDDTNYILYISYNGNLNYSYKYSNYKIRPVINLKKEVIGG